jgi:spermidine/putrescine transport system ATP-binding protein
LPPGHVELVDLTKKFADVLAVDALGLQIEQGEFFSLLGPSGCGKTTTLRLVAGFEEPTSGRILLDGIDVGRLPPNKRNVNTVFQSYALFPFLDVAGNVAFGLKRQSLDKSEIKRRVGEVLELVQLPGYEKRRVNQLSGGQQQRVALARALVLHPAVLLLDEPLGALDAKLRRTLQVELKAIQERVGITFLYVTHDQEEALTMSDRIAVMSQGRIAQVGTPRVLYEEPADAYVADFLGVSNLMDAQVVRPGAAPGDFIRPGAAGGDFVRPGAAGGDAVAAGSNGRPCTLRMGDFEVEAGCGSVGATGTVRLAVRPERVQLRDFGTTGQNCLPAMVERLVFLGSASQVFVRLAPGALLQALVQNDGLPVPWSQGTPVSVRLPPEALRVLEVGGTPKASQAGEVIRNGPLVNGLGTTDVPDHQARAEVSANTSG